MPSPSSNEIVGDCVKTLARLLCASTQKLGSVIVNRALQEQITIPDKGKYLNKAGEILKECLDEGLSPPDLNNVLSAWSAWLEAHFARQHHVMVFEGFTVPTVSSHNKRDTKMRHDLSQGIRAYQDMLRRWKLLRAAHRGRMDAPRIIQFLPNRRGEVPTRIQARIGGEISEFANFWEFQQAIKKNERVASTKHHNVPTPRLPSPFSALHVLEAYARDVYGTPGVVYIESKLFPEKFTEAKNLEASWKPSKSHGKSPEYYRAKLGILLWNSRLSMRTILRSMNALEGYERYNPEENSSDRGKALKAWLRKFNRRPEGADLPPLRLRKQVSGS